MSIVFIDISFTKKSPLLRARPPSGSCAATDTVVATLGCRVIVSPPPSYLFSRCPIPHPGGRIRQFARADHQFFAYLAGDKPHRYCSRRSSVRKTNPSTMYPMAMIRIITASTWLMSFKSRPIISN